MSRFYNETHNVKSEARAGLRADTIDLRELVESLRLPDGLQRQKPQAVVEQTESQRAIEDQYKHAEGGVDHEILHQCRRFRLPGNSQKTFLDVQKNGDAMAAEAYRTLRTRLLRLHAKNSATLINITGTAEGEGKTLTAMNLALCYTQIQGSRVLLVDADLRTRGLSAKFLMERFSGLGNVLEDQCSYESAIARMEKSNLYVMPAGTSSMPAPELLSRSAWAEFTGWAKRMFDVVIVDSPPALDFADFELIAEVCDGIVLVTRSGKTKRQALARILEQLDRKKLLGIVFNDSNELPAQGYYERYLKSG